MEMEQKPMNLKPRDSSGDRKKTYNELLAEYVSQLAMAMGQELPVERVTLYLKALHGLSETQLRHGFTIALERFKPDFGKTFPYPAEIREWGESWRPAEPTAQDLAARYEAEDERKAIQTEAGPIPVPRGVSASEIAQWLEEGKRKQREHIAKLHADPQWQREAERLGAFPGLPGAAAERAAAQRNGVSQVPSGPSKRAPWAKQKAKEQGWI
jgi:hypothetical protein